MLGGFVEVPSWLSDGDARNLGVRRLVIRESRDADDRRVLVFDTGSFESLGRPDVVLDWRGSSMVRVGPPEVKVIASLGSIAAGRGNVSAYNSPRQQTRCTLPHTKSVLSDDLEFEGGSSKR
jgi:hypothetical protein